MVPQHVGMIASLSREQTGQLHSFSSLQTRFSCLLLLIPTATFSNTCLCQHVYHPLEKPDITLTEYGSGSGLLSVCRIEIMGLRLPNIIGSRAVGPVPSAGLT